MTPACRRAQWGYSITTLSVIVLVFGAPLLLLLSKHAPQSAVSSRFVEQEEVSAEKKSAVAKMLKHEEMRRQHTYAEQEQLEKEKAMHSLLAMLEKRRDNLSQPMVPQEDKEHVVAQTATPEVYEAQVPPSPPEWTRWHGCQHNWERAQLAPELNLYMYEAGLATREGLLFASVLLHLDDLAHRSKGNVYHATTPRYFKALLLNNVSCVFGHGKDQLRVPVSAVWQDSIDEEAYHFATKAESSSLPSTAL